ncbi:MAG: MMPL family transporter [Bacteroidales bacterium]|nr:MMPL family transporter [Bacteroidales bacterium]
MGYFAFQTTISNEMMDMLPKSNPTSQDYQRFKERFGADGAVIFIAFRDDSLFTVNHFNNFYNFSKDIASLKGIQGCLSAATMFSLYRDDSVKQFKVRPIFQHCVSSQEELDSLRQEFDHNPLYDGLLYNKETNVYLIMATLKNEVVNNSERIALVDLIQEKGLAFGQQNNVEVHFSGMPYIRTETTKMIKNEMVFYLILAFVVAIVLLYVFFRSFSATFFSIFIVAVITVWAYGVVGVLGFRLTVLTAIVPTVIVIMGVENCIFLLNKYHLEYKSHRNKIKALSRVIQHIGNANFLTNVTTAVGFASFTITGNTQLVEFGLVASLGIMANYILSLILLPTIYSYLKPPKDRHVKHLSGKFINGALTKIIYLVENKRAWVYAMMFLLLAAAGIGISRLQTTGNIVDEVPHDHRVYQDLLFMEKHFNGVMPMEIVVDTKNKKGVLNRKTLQKVDSLQMEMEKYSEFSKSLSLANAVKYLKQAYYGGDPDFYEMPTNNELSFIINYLPDLSAKQENVGFKMLSSFVDSSFQVMRITVQVENIGTKEIAKIRSELQETCNQLFPPDKYDVSITGAIVVFLEGTNYLTDNLFYSLLLAAIVIACLMSLLFNSIRMIAISMIPNIVPLVVTAGLMGYLGIPIKPSTILIFGASLGISVNDSIHYLSRYRLQLRATGKDIPLSVIKALREAGHSMIYSVTILFFGFGVFTLSSFGGIQVLGFLIPVTLMMALFCNLFFLPSLLLSGKRSVTNKNFTDPPYQIIEDDEENGEGFEITE